MKLKEALDKTFTVTITRKVRKIYSKPPYYEFKGTKKMETPLYGVRCTDVL